MIKPDAGNSALFGKVGLAKARLRALVNCFFRGCKKIMRGKKREILFLRVYYCRKLLKR